MRIKGWFDVKTLKLPTESKEEGSCSGFGIGAKRLDNGGGEACLLEARGTCSGMWSTAPPFLQSAAGYEGLYWPGASSPGIPTDG